MSEHVMLVCASHDRPHAPGYWSLCCLCKTKIFVSDTSHDAIAEHGFHDYPIRLYCMKCGHVQMKKYKPPVAPLTEAQIEEIERGRK